MLLQQRCLKSIGGSTPLSPCPSGSPCSRLRLPAGPSWTECGFPDQQGLLSCCFTVRQVDRNQLARLASTIRISVDCHVIWGWAHHKMGNPTISAREGESPGTRGPYGMLAERDWNLDVCRNEKCPCCKILLSVMCFPFVFWSDLSSVFQTSQKTSNS